MARRKISFDKLREVHTMLGDLLDAADAAARDPESDDQSGAQDALPSNVRNARAMVDSIPGLKRFT
jgi:hypothetical protein